jgi:hypothetical protein
VLTRKEGNAVSDRSIGALPAWVSKGDGRLEPFDADKICQSLFAASEALGAPNAFLARELTDAVVHFLAAEPAEPAPSTGQISEQVVKVVRELGQPALAQAFSQGAAGRKKLATAPDPAPPSVTVTFRIDESPQAVVERCLRAYTERVVFSRDLIAARGDGLLKLGGMETPRCLASCVLDPVSLPDLGSHLAAIGDAAGQGVVLDGPEWHTSGAADQLPPAIVLGWLTQFPAVVRRSVVVNLNSAQPPAWARHRGGGPLFAEVTAPPLPLLDAVLEAMPAAQPRLRWDWHVQARDFVAGPHRDRLRRAARLALEGRSIAFVFDRPRRPVGLAEGMDRPRPAVLMEIGLDLPAFLHLPSIAGRGDVLRDKLTSLARMAVSAGAQKRKYLRRHAEGTALTRGFLLDRARLAVVPLGLDAVVREISGQAAAASPLSLDLACQLVRDLHEHLQAAGRTSHLEVGLDSPGPALDSRDPGLSCADAAVSVDRQFAAAGALHAVAGQGTARVIVPPGEDASPDILIERLQFAWRRTELLRVIFLRPAEPVRQPELSDT